MILYHFTKEEYLAKILTEGLKPYKDSKCPGLSVGGFSKKSFRNNVIWLTDNPEFILHDQMGKSWYNSNKMVLLDVRIEDVLVARPLKTYLESCKMTFWDYEFICLETIKPQYITVSERKLDLLKIPC